MACLSFVHSVLREMLVLFMRVEFKLTGGHKTLSNISWSLAFAADSHHDGGR